MESVKELEKSGIESTKPLRSVERGEPPHFAADLEPTTPCAPPYLNCIVHPARTQNSARSVSPRCTAGSLLFRTATRVAHSRILYRCLAYRYLPYIVVSPYIRVQLRLCPTYHHAITVLHCV